MAHKDDKTELNPRNEKEFIEDALARFKMSAEEESDIRKKSLDDLKFSLGDQWPTAIEEERTTDQRPCITINKMKQMIRQVTNQERQARHAIRINPADDEATVDSAKILQGLMRNIEYRSESKEAWDHGFDMMCRIGLGFVRIAHEYLEGDTIEQEILIDLVENPFSIYFDPHCKKRDYSDARFAFVTDALPREQFEIMHPKSELCNLKDFTGLGDTQKEWVDEETVTVAEYYYVEETKVTLYQLSDGRVTRTKPTEEDLAEIFDEKLQQVVVPAVTIKAEHEKIERDVKWAKITAVEVLEEEDLKGKFIPIVPILGDKYIVDGKKHLAGMVRDGKDPARVYNYEVTNAIETIALAPRAPFIVVEGQLEGHEDEWESSNRRNWAYLTVKGWDSKGNPVALPQRQIYEPPIQAMMAGADRADHDLKSTMGIFEPSLGERGPEESGRAILARQTQSNIANMNYSDNLARAYRHAGRIILDLIPKIYDVPRVQKIVNPDGQVDTAVTYKGQEQAALAKQMMEKRGIKQALDVSAGRYSLTVSVGASYQTKRQEQAESQLEFMKVYPASAPMIADLVADNMDWEGADEVAKRLKFALPPELQGEEGQDDPKMQVVALQSQKQQLMQQHEALTKALKEASETIRTKQLELSSKEQIAGLQARIELVKVQAKIEGEAALALLKQQLSDVGKEVEAFTRQATEKESQAETTAVS